MFRFGGGMENGVMFVKASAINYTALITDNPAINFAAGDKADVLAGEGEFTASKIIFWTDKKYKHPSGLYIVKNDIDLDPINTVSYTHLTLPTKRIV